MFTNYINRIICLTTKLKILINLVTIPYTPTSVSQYTYKRNEKHSTCPYTQSFRKRVKKEKRYIIRFKDGGQNQYKYTYNGDFL